jgi:hypothetical protein
MEVCSPDARDKNYKKDKSCFDRPALVRMATLMKITNIAKKSKQQLWTDINALMIDKCGGSGREWCWVDAIGPEAKHSTSITKNLRPVKPSEWYKEPHAWLSNRDIEVVMKQYADVKDNHYAFLGVFPIDFHIKDAYGKCMYEEICLLNIETYAKKRIKYIGFITNLDKHDEPGSHWTSTFVCIDKNMPCCGAYYYDSVSRLPPPDVKMFMENVKKKIDALDGPHECKLGYSKRREQSGNTECGMFSMIYQLRWLKGLQKNPNALFKDIMSNPLNDKDVHNYRDILFRPNAAVVLKKGK